jgi:hypothetical protein
MMSEAELAQARAWAENAEQAFTRGYEAERQAELTRLGF